MPAVALRGPRPGEEAFPPATAKGNAGGAVPWKNANWDEAGFM